MPWFGKAYFAISILISVIATRILGLFGPNTSSYNVLNLTVKLIGLALLGMSTPNLEISSVLMLAALNREHIEYFLWRYYLTMAASQPTYYLTGKRVRVLGASLLSCHL